MRHLTTTSALLLTTAVVLLGACGNDESTAVPVGGAGTEPGSTTVEIERSRYAPTELTVAAGGSVAYVNLDRFDHTVTAAAGSRTAFDSGDLGQDETFTQVFEEPGTYDYFCTIHPTMRATVTVE